MRRLLVLALALSLATAGCLGGEDAADDAQATGGAEADLPAPIHDQRRVETAASPGATPDGQPCPSEASDCYTYPFTLEEESRLQARLDWSNVTSDFDLHVVDADGKTVVASKSSPPGTNEQLDEALEPGSYELIVVAWAVPGDTYQLEAQFGYP